jgi:hypothetical protein
MQHKEDRKADNPVDVIYYQIFKVDRWFHFVKQYIDPRNFLMALFPLTHEKWFRVKTQWIWMKYDIGWFIIYV